MYPTGAHLSTTVTGACLPAASRPVASTYFVMYFECIIKNSREASFKKGLVFYEIKSWEENKPSPHCKCELVSF